MASYSTKMRVFQSWGTTAPGTATDQNVFVFGPKYDLHRYTDADERALLTPFEYTADIASSDADTTFAGAFALADNGYELDVASVHVYAENAYTDKGVTITSSNVHVLGSHYDGVLFIDGASLASSVKKGDYICFQKKVSTTLTTDFVRVASVDGTATRVEPAEQEGGEDTTVSGTKVTLVSGIPDMAVDSTALATGVTIAVAEKHDSIKLSEDAYTQSGTSLVIHDMSTYDDPLIYGTIYAGFRAKYVGASSGVDMFSSVSDVETVLGKADPDNPISMGVVNAFIGGAPVVYYYITPGDKEADMAGALDAAATQKSFYYLVPMTQDAEALDRVVSEAKRLSKEETKRWRIVFLCSAVGKEVSAEVSLTGSGQYASSTGTWQILKVASMPETLSDGDEVSFSSVGTAYKFTVTRKLNDTTILTKEAYSSSVPATFTPAVTGTVKHVYTSAEYAAAVAGAGRHFGTLRVVDCFPKTYGFGGDTYNSMYMAPILAGLAASVFPQAPITNATVPGVDDLPDTYSWLNEAQLDTIAAGGVMIVMQDIRNDGVYIRKQLTTSKEGSIVTTELSCVKNFDNVTHRFSNLMDGFKGSHNVTPKLVSMVELRLGTLLHELMYNSPDDMVGPQLLTGSEVRDVYVDPTNATRIIAHVHCVVPAPFNEMDLYLSCDVTSDVEASVETGAQA